MIQFYNGHIFTGDIMLLHHTVTANGAYVEMVSEAAPRVGSVVDLEGGFLVPAFIDLQVYGGNGSLFAAHPSVNALKATYAAALAGGTTHIMPTMATNSTEKMLEAIDAVRQYLQSGLPGILGLHLEGPYINPGKKGAHIEHYIKTPDMAELELLLEAGRGIIQIMTLAPECCSTAIIDRIQKENILVSAGHSNATYVQATAAFNRGIPLATHLYNAMSPLHHREPGITGAVLHHPTVCASIVADGHHVNYAAIAIAKQLMGNRLFLITDAVTENSTGPYQHRLEGNKYVVGEGILSGSSLTMLQAVKNCVQYAGIELPEALRMASLYPARIVGRAGWLGKIFPGYAAELLWLDASLQLKGVYTQGSLQLF